jgi:hypothetical protein
VNAGVEPTPPPFVPALEQEREAAAPLRPDALPAAVLVQHLRSLLLRLIHH